MSKQASPLETEEGLDREDIEYLRKYGDELPNPVVDKSPYYCPKCAKLSLGRISLILKWGAFGSFLTCPRFPDCRFTMVLPKPSPSNPYFQSYKGLKCKKCDGTGLLPFYKAGKEIPHVFVYCECHKELEPYYPAVPEDFDFPCSYVWRVYYDEIVNSRARGSDLERSSSGKAVIPSAG